MSTPPPPALRRPLALTGLVVGGVTLLLALPALPLLALVDVVRGRRFAICRLYLVLLHLLSREGVGLLGALWIGATCRRGTQAWYDRHSRIQNQWGDAVLRGVLGIQGARLQEAPLHALVAGRALVLSRHASLRDTLLPIALGARGHSLRLRYVLKQELLWGPCMDIVGNRLINAFVARGAGEREDDLRAVAALAHDLGPRDVIVIYPEGTRATPAKRARILEKLDSAGDADRLARARSLKHTLPPRTGGINAVLDQGPIDVVFLAHTGFEGVADLRALLDGRLQGRTVRAQAWRVPAADVPTEANQRARWLAAHWQRVDDTVGAWLGDGDG